MKLFLTLILLLNVCLSYSQDFEIDQNELIDETQVSSSDPNEMSLVWWIPIEYWEVAFALEKTISKEQLDEIIAVLNPYTIIAVVDGKMGPFGRGKICQIRFVNNSV